MSTDREVDELEFLPETEGEGQTMRVKLADGKTYVFHDVTLHPQPAQDLAPGESVVRVEPSNEPMTEQQRQYYDWLLRR